MSKYLLFLFLMVIIGCSDKGETPVEHTFQFYSSLTHDGETRTYLVHLPSNYYDNNTNRPLIIGLHGGSGDAYKFETLTELSTSSDANGFIVVYPEGLPGTGALKVRSWNAGKCCGSNAEDNTDDVGFISKLITELESTYHIDSKRIYLAGHSNGAMLSYRLACELSDKIAAIATNAGTMQVKTACTPSRVVPVIHFHSKLDQHVPYQGGVGSEGVGQWNPSVDSTLNVVSTLASCDITKQTVTTATKYTSFTWKNCNNSLVIDYYLTEDGGHSWPGGNKSDGLDSDEPSTAIVATDLLWSFFQKYSLP